MKIKTYSEIYIAERKRLRAAGIEAYDMEARLLAAYAAGKTVERFLADARLIAPDGGGFEPALRAAADRRIAGEPVAQIIGEWVFYGLPIHVSGDVLIPRTDTEVLAQAAIALLRERAGPLRVLDLCAGTGCVGLAIAANVENCRVVLADVTPGAFTVSKQNIVRNSLTKSVTYIEVSALEPPPPLLGRFDLIVCNPPYIPTGDIPGLDASVRDYEPHIALDGGADGMTFYRYIPGAFRAVLKEGGALAFECGIGQAADVQACMAAAGYEAFCVHKDTLGIDRVVTGKIQGGNDGGREEKVS